MSWTVDNANCEDILVKGFHFQKVEDVTMALCGRDTGLAIVSWVLIVHKRGGPLLGLGKDTLRTRWCSSSKAVRVSRTIMDINKRLSRSLRAVVPQGSTFCTWGAISSRTKSSLNTDFPMTSGESFRRVAQNCLSFTGSMSTLCPQLTCTFVGQPVWALTTFLRVVTHMLRRHYIH